MACGVIYLEDEVVERVADLRIIAGVRVCQASSKRQRKGSTNMRWSLVSKVLRTSSAQAIARACWSSLREL